jgi:circadian clock protein KaiC
LENHLVRLHELVGATQPDAVILDPITSFATIGDLSEVKIMLTRVIDFLKGAGITAIFTALRQGAEPGHLERTDEVVSSLIDTWVLLQMAQVADRRKRLLSVLKSRGMAHSQEVRELLLGDTGIDLVNAAADLVRLDV